MAGSIEKQTIKLKEFIGSLISLNQEEWDCLCGYLKVKTIRKNEFLLREGSVCNSIYYVDSGVLIYYKSLENGDEITTDFAIAGDWVADNLSRLNNSPSLLNIKAISDSELICIKNADLLKLFSEIPKLERLGRILIEQAFISVVQQTIDLQILSAKERYLKLLNTRPDVFQLVPLHHIANYLGVAPKSLSRIRNEISPEKFGNKCGAK